MARFRLFAGLVLGLGAFAAGVRLEGGQLRALLHNNTLLAFAGAVLGVMMASYNWRTWQKSFGLAFRMDSDASEEVNEAMEFFTRMGRAAVLVGFTVFAVSLIHVFRNFYSMEIAGLGLATSIIGPLYGIALKTFVSDTLRNRVESCRHGKQGTRAKVHKLRRAA